VFVLAAAQSVVKVSSWKDLKSKIDNQAGQSFLLTSPFDIAGAAQIMIKAFQNITITGEDGVVLDGKNLPVYAPGYCDYQQLFLNHGGSLDVSGITFRNLQCGFLQNGIELYSHSQPVTTVSNCVFDNVATGNARTVALLTAGAAFTNCTFENQISRVAVFSLTAIRATETVLSNCIFRNNTATIPLIEGPAGGAIYVWTWNATLRLRGCQFILPSNASLGHNDITMAVFTYDNGTAMYPPGKGEWAPSADSVQSVLDP
jgi:hypothetical protein